MSIRIKFAESAQERDGVHRVRHHVFAEDEGYFSARGDGRLVDETDALPQTRCLAAIDGGDVIGTVRLTEPSQDGLPTDPWWDFGPALPDGARPAAGSMLCVARSHRENPKVFLGLMGMAHHWLTSRGYTHVVALTNPDIAHLFDWGGGKRVGEQFLHEEIGLPAIPMVIDLSVIAERIDTFAARQRIDHFLNGFEREFAAPDEVVIRKGDTTDTTYVIIDGRVAVMSGNGAGPGSGDVIAELGSGQVFGEIAPLLGQARTADVVALTDVELMVIESDALRAQLGAAGPARHMLELMARRLASQSSAIGSALDRAEVTAGSSPAE